MALNISLWVVPWPVFFIALILIVAAVIVLTFIERTLHKKIVLRKKEADTYFQKRVEAVAQFRNEPQKFLVGINDVAKEFFKKEYSVLNSRYFDLANKFKESGKMEVASFCNEMQETLYSGEKLNDEKLSVLYNKLLKIIINKEKEIEQFAAKSSGQAVEEEIKENVVEPKQVPMKPAEIPQRKVEERKIVKEAPKKELHETPKGKGIILNFFKPKSKEIDVIKKEVGEGEAPKPRNVDVTPYETEKPEFENKEYPQKEPKSYSYISNMDDLERVKSKIQKRRVSMAEEGYRGASLR